MLRITSLCKSYGREEAVSKLTLEVPDGEVFGLLGPNGAGKTTTLKIICGLVVPDCGSIIVDGIDSTEDPEKVRSLLYYVPDEPTLYDRLSGREFLRFVGRMRGIGPDVLEERIHFHENLFDMHEWLDSRAEGYSHGMTQRVVLSSAFISKPRLYVIDEPLVGLDPATAETFNRMIRAAAGAGATVILSTHTLPVAREYCDRLGIIHQGELVSTFGTGDTGGEELQERFFRITGTSPANVSEFFST